ncbi:hypothetical protein MKW94_026500 [Papaver nudicaule]|uniref:Inosine/uridine-preferring nucleoside hydrolase domain-containing protein n=1 Tax=Papaver nudicaule TaxID=74823 RepID=A0AA41V261_PAPNU|nr:hypothetical protein [Papaver nudicaule]
MSTLLLKPTYMEIQKQLMLCSLLGLISMFINITTQCTLTDEDLSDLRESKGRHAQFSSDMCKFYRDWHVKSDGLCGIFLHDPISFVALVRTDLFTYKKGVVRVETQGICVGLTLMDQGLKTHVG